MIDRKEGLKKYNAVLEEEAEKCRSVKQMNMILWELGQMRRLLDDLEKDR